MWKGEGARLVDGQPLLLDMYIESLDTGEVLENTYDGLPRPFLLAPELLGDNIYNALLKARVGTRVLAVSPPAGEFDESRNRDRDRCLARSRSRESSLPLRIPFPWSPQARRESPR